MTLSPGDFSHGQVSSVVFDADRIARRVEALGREITEFHGGSDDLLVLGVLKGSFIFVADLVRAVHLPLQVEFLVASSYGDRQSPSGEVRVRLDPEVRIRDRDVVLVEDIVDRGGTLGRVVPLLEAQGPRSLEICALLHKRQVRPYKEPRWVGFDAPGEFLVGYGLDHAGELRHLPFIGSL